MFKNDTILNLLVINAVKLGDKELFGHPKIAPYRQMFLILMK